MSQKDQQNSKKPTAPASGAVACSASVLDMCCGSRMFWFDREDERAVFLDNRNGSYRLRDKSSNGGFRKLHIQPNILADFKALPFCDNQFNLVVYDPPHLKNAGENGWQAKKYGKLPTDWRSELKQGFAEGFRVLKPGGTLIFKWNEHEISVARILELTAARPLFGNRCGKRAKTHWLVFLKPND